MPQRSVEKQYYEMPELVGFQPMVILDPNALMLWVSLVWPFNFYLNLAHHTVILHFRQEVVKI